MERDKDELTTKRNGAANSEDRFEREVTTDLDDETPDKPKGMPLHTRIMIGLLVGVVAGVAVNALVGGDNPTANWVIANVTEPIGQLFLRLLLMVVVPLVFSALVVGVAGIGDIRKLGRVGAKSFVYTLIISAISVVIGLTLTNTIRPGERIDPETRTQLETRYSADAQKRVTDAQKTTVTDSPMMQVGENHRPCESDCFGRGRDAEHAAPDVLRAHPRRGGDARSRARRCARASRHGRLVSNLVEDH
jgi:DAACS family dicarboxylate/amino acid:cation (Na+ or H+) symporter